MSAPWKKCSQVDGESQDKAAPDRKRDAWGHQRVLGESGRFT